MTYIESVKLIIDWINWAYVIGCPLGIGLVLFAYEIRYAPRIEENPISMGRWE